MQRVKLIETAEAVLSSGPVIALTGAGISVESGIPDFRSPGGLWEVYDPSIYASISTFEKSPERCWDMLFPMMELILKAEPNAAHLGLADLEREGVLKSVITQNIDSLHSRAGSVNVIEYHGSASRLVCTRCRRVKGLEDFDPASRVVPLCGECGIALKPDIVFFGENIPVRAFADAAELASKAGCVIVAGSSAEVFPAASIPLEAKRNGAIIVEFNIRETGLTSSFTDYFISGRVGETMPAFVSALLSVREGL